MSGRGVTAPEAGPPARTAGQGGGAPVRPKRSLGQNFLVDPNLQRQVVKPGEIAPFVPPPPDDLDIWAYMDDAKAAAEVKYLVAHSVHLIPAFIEKGMGLQKGWSRFEAEDRKLFANEAVQFYYPEERRLNLLGNYANPPHIRPQVRERRERQGERRAGPDGSSEPLSTNAGPP